MFTDLSQHPEWLKPQSLPWCNQLAAQTGTYAYPWVICKCSFLLRNVIV